VERRCIIGQNIFPEDAFEARAGEGSSLPPLPQRAGLVDACSLQATVTVASIPEPKPRHVRRWHHDFQSIFIREWVDFRTGAEARASPHIGGSTSSGLADHLSKDLLAAIARNGTGIESKR